MIDSWIWEHTHTLHACLSAQKCASFFFFFSFFFSLSRPTCSWMRAEELTQRKKIEKHKSNSKIDREYNDTESGHNNCGERGEKKKTKEKVKLCLYPQQTEPVSPSGHTDSFRSPPSSSSESNRVEKRKEKRKTQWYCLPYAVRVMWNPETVQYDCVSTWLQIK